MLKGLRRGIRDESSPFSLRALEKSLVLALGASLEKFRGQRMGEKPLEVLLVQFQGEPRGTALRAVRAHFLEKFWAGIREKFRGMALE